MLLFIWWRLIRKERPGPTMGLILLTVLLCNCSIDEQIARPNIVFILADDLGWSDVGYQGVQLYETPNIDQLASQGLILSRFYPGAANCAPARACMLSGMYSPRHHIYLPQGLSRGGPVTQMRWKVITHGQDSTFNTFEVSNNNLEPRFESLAEVLKKAGYISARLGKWHLGDDNQGFDRSSASGTWEEITNIDGGEMRFYSDTLVASNLTTSAIEFIRENQDQPFFLYLSHWEVHSPMAAKRSRISHFRKKLDSLQGQGGDPVYAAEVEQIDWSVGRIITALEELGLTDNTLVIFTSDNGGVSDLTSNEPLRAGKGTFYEGGIRTPLCIKWPRVIEPGSVSDFPINGVDLLPTLAELVSAPLPSTQPVDGISFYPLLKGEQLEGNRKMFFHFPLYLGRGGRDRVLPAYGSTTNVWRAVPLTVMMQGDWKLIYYYEYDDFELFNLREDISEQNDLSQSRPVLSRKLVDDLIAWTSEVNAPVPRVANEQFGTEDLSNRSNESI